MLLNKTRDTKNELKCHVKNDRLDSSIEWQFDECQYEIIVSYIVEIDELTSDHVNIKSLSYLTERDRLSNRCRFELTFFNLSVSMQSRVDSFYCRLFTRWEDDRIVKHFHCRLLIRRADDRVRVNSFYCLNAIERWSVSLHSRWLSKLVSWSNRCDYECEFAYEEIQISKNTIIHDLSDWTACQTVATSLSRAAYAKFELIIY